MGGLLLGMPDSYREPVEEKSGVSSSVPVNSAEQEILELEKILAAKKAALGGGKELSASLSSEASAKGESLAEKEKPLEQIVGQDQAAGPLPVLPPSGKSSAPVLQAKEKAGEFKRYQKNQQLKGLIDIAFQKGISHAVDVVKEMDNPFLMDELHDVLVDELHKELIERGKMEEI
jgi:hypothetical protein